MHDNYRFMQLRQYKELWGLFLEKRFLWTNNYFRNTTKNYYRLDILMLNLTKPSIIGASVTKLQSNIGS